MLKLLRIHATSWIIKILLGAIVVVFVFWGVGSWRTQRATRVALVNGSAITRADYQEAYNAIMEQLQQQFGNRLTDDMIKMFQVQKQAIDALIHQILLRQEAERLGLKTTKEELSDKIRGMPAFQRSGVFDSKLYRQVLGRYRMTPEQFEKAQQDALLVDKVRYVITDSVKVSETEAKQWYDWNHAAVDVDFIRFEPTLYKNIEIGQEELKKYFDANKTSYKTDPEVKIRYVRLDPEAFASQVTIGNGEIEQYYAENPDEFKIPKTVEARHILFMTEPEMTPEEIEAKRRKALEIMAMAKGGRDFSSLAKEFSEDPSRENGGYLGTFRRESMVEAFAEKAFSMSAGEISEPVQTQFGWHIIKVEKVNEAFTRPLKDAQSEIREKLVDKAARILAYDAAEAVYEKTYDTDDLAKIAEEKKLQLYTTDFFDKKGPEKGVSNREKIAAIAFGLSPMEFSSVEDMDDGYTILQVLEKRPERIPEQEEVREKVAADLLKHKQQQRAEKDAKACLASLKAGGDMHAESKKYGLAVVSSGFFKRRDSIPNIGYEPEFSREAFRLTEDSRLSDKEIKGAGGYYIIRLREKKAPDVERFDKEKENLMESLRQQKQTRLFTSWLEHLKNESTITIEADFLKDNEQ